MRWCLPLLLAACAADNPSVEETLAARRAALGLGNEPLGFDAGMRALDKGRYEDFLAETYAGRRKGPEVLEAALRIGNFVARSAPPPDRPPDFADRLRRTRALADALARASAAGEDERDPARALLHACMDCHVKYRKPR